MEGKKEGQGGTEKLKGEEGRKKEESGWIEEGEPGADDCRKIWKLWASVREGEEHGHYHNVNPAFQKITSQFHSIINSTPFLPLLLFSFCFSLPSFSHLSSFHLPLFHCLQHPLPTSQHPPSPPPTCGLEMQNITSFWSEPWFHNFISVLRVRTHCIRVCVCVFYSEFGIVHANTNRVSRKYIFQDGSRASGKEQSRNVFLISVKLMQTLVYQMCMHAHTQTHTTLNTSLEI